MDLGFGVKSRTAGTKPASRGCTCSCYKRDFHLSATGATPSPWLRNKMGRIPSPCQAKQRIDSQVQHSSSEEDTQQDSAYNLFDSLLGGTSSSSASKQPQKPRVDRRPATTGISAEEEHAKYREMEREFARKSGGLFSGTDPQAPRALLKAKKKYSTPEMEAARQDALEDILAQYARPKTEEPKMELLVQRPSRPGFPANTPQRNATPTGTAQEASRPRPTPALAGRPIRSADNLRESIRTAGSNSLGDNPKSVQRRMPGTMVAMDDNGAGPQFSDKEFQELLRSTKQVEEKQQDDLMQIAERPVLKKMPKRPSDPETEEPQKPALKRDSFEPAEGIPKVVQESSRERAVKESVPEPTLVKPSRVAPLESAEMPAERNVDCSDAAKQVELQESSETASRSTADAPATAFAGKSVPQEIPKPKRMLETADHQTLQEAPLPFNSSQADGNAEENNEKLSAANEEAHGQGQSQSGDPLSQLEAESKPLPHPRAPSRPSNHQIAEASKRGESEAPTTSQEGAEGTHLFRPVPSSLPPNEDLTSTTPAVKRPTSSVIPMDWQQALGESKQRSETASSNPRGLRQPNKEKMAMWLSEVKVAQRLREAGEKVSVKVVFAKWGGLVVEAMDQSFKGFLPHRLMDATMSQRLLQVTESRTQHPDTAIKLDGEILDVYVHSVKMKQNQEDGTPVYGNPRRIREIIVSQIDPKKSQSVDRGSKVPYSAEVAAVLAASEGAVVEATVRGDAGWGVFVDFDVATDDGAVTPVLAMIHNSEYWPPKQAPQVGTNVNAVVARVNKGDLKTYLSIRQLKARDLEEQQDVEGDMPEAVKVCEALAKRGVSAKPGQRRRGAAYTQELQVFLGKGARAGLNQDGASTYHIVVRLGNENQTLTAKTHLDHGGMATAIREATNEAIGQAPL